MMMPVETNQWRATIGCFRVSMHILSPVSKRFRPFSLSFQIFKLYWFCCSFIAIAIFALPLSLTVQFLAEFSMVSKLSFLPLFARVHHFARTVMYATVELLKRIPLSVICLVWHKHFAIQQFLFAYTYFYMGCLLCNTLHSQWLVFRIILLSGDIEMNPGPETLDFCTWNLNSITAHDFLRVSLIEAFNSVYKHDLIGVVETHLDSTFDDDRLTLDGYNFFKSNHPQNVKRGGVGLYVKESLPSQNRSDLVTLPECVVCEIQLNRKKYFFVVIYRSPSQDQSEFDDFTVNFELLLSKLHAESPFCIVITGDFNCRSTQWWEHDIENNEGRIFEPFVSELGLHQLISEPTHFMGDSKSCIDLIFTDQPNLVVDSGVYPSLHEQCHHQIVYGKLSVSNIALPSHTRRVWYYNKANIVAIMRSIEMFHWHQHLGTITCPNDQVKFLNEVLLNIYSNFIPNKVKTIRPRQAPWVTQTVKNFLRKKNHAYKSFLKNGQPDDKLEGIQKMITDGSRLIEDAKRNYFLKTGNTLAHPGTSNRTYWSLINTVLNKAKIPIIPPLLENGLFVTDFTEKAQLFNDYFILQCTTIDTGSEIPQYIPVAASSLNNFVISDEKILKIIRSLNSNKAHGCDEISVRMIKLSDTALVVPLKIIFTNCLRCGVFPQIWKCANVVPVHKKNEKNLKGNYRPISLLPIFGKILEKLIYDSLYSHLVSCELLNPNQSGFRPGDSTINQLISITHTIFKAFDCNPPLDVRSVYLDISKAFDRVWHDGLLYKLERCGVSGQLLSLIRSFLKDRKQRTVLNGKSSVWGDISAGVPQGSILGPLFFLVYINDLTENLKCNVKLFADDTSLFTVVQNPNTAASDMNHDLDLIKQWAFLWRMSFNPDPQKQAVEIIFSRKRNKIDHPVILFNDTPVKKVDEHKHLGLLLDSKLSFAAHIKAAIGKSRKSIGLLKYLSNYLPRHTLNELYKLYVRPHLDYGDVIYHIPAKVCEFSGNVTLPNLMEKLESVQYSAAQAVSGAWKGTSREKLYAELGWESLSSRRWSRRLILFYKFINSLTPKYTTDPIPPLRQSRYSLRKQDAIGRIRTRTEKFQSTFYPHCLSEWNKLDPEIRHTPSIAAFKTKLLSKIRPLPKSVFRIHDPTGLSYLTQLRVGLSKLNFHKFKHNFRDTTNPMCPTNDGIEDTEHFLLLCPSFDVPRRDLLAGVSALLRPLGHIDLSNEFLMQILLYGDKDFPNNLNKDILLLTLRFIHETGRFN